MSAPIRIQRKRTKGWKMPPNTVYVGRPTKYGNPYLLGGWTRSETVELYRKWIARTYGGWIGLAMIRSELRGKNLACWCPLDQPCHADILLEIANSRERG